MCTPKSLSSRWVLCGALFLLIGLALLMPRPVLGATCTSSGTMNWSSGASWSCGSVPTTNDAVVIASGSTVTINTSPITVASITVNGTGILRFDNTGTSRAMTVTGDVTINSGATFDTATGGSASTHALTLSGNLTNDGTFDGLPASGRIINLTFNKNGNQTVSGSGATTRFNNVTLNMGSQYTNTLDVQSVIAMTSGGLTLNNGTFKLSSASTLTPFSGAETITTTAGLWNNGGTLNGSSGSLTVFGLFKQSAGTTTVGTSASHALKIEQANTNVQISGGTLNINGRWQQLSGGSTNTLNISGGTINVSTGGQTSNGTIATFQVPTGNNFNMSAGSIVIQNAGNDATPTGDLKITNSSASITGGTFVIGKGAGTTGNIQIRSDAKLYNLTLDAGSTTPALTATLTLSNHLTLSSGTLATNNNNLTLAGNWSNNAGSTAFTAGTGTVTFDGTATQSITGTHTTTFNNLTINSGAIVVLATKPLVSGTLTHNGLLRETQTVNGNSDVDFICLGSTSTNCSAYKGATLNANNSDLGSTTVDVMGNRLCGGVTSTVKRCFDLRPTNTTSRNANVTLYFLDSERNGETCATLNAWRYNGASFVAAGTTGTRQCTSDPRSIQTTGVTNFSVFALKTSSPSVPTPITIASIQAQSGGPDITLAVTGFGVLGVLLLGGISIALTKQRNGLG